MAKSHAINESDTVVIVTDLLQEIFGYDKYEAREADVIKREVLEGEKVEVARKQVSRALRTTKTEVTSRPEPAGAATLVSTEPGTELQE